MTIAWVVEPRAAHEARSLQATALGARRRGLRALGALYYGRDRDYMGGAEVQATVLAHALKRRGLRVAHIVYPVKEPRPAEASSPTLVERSEWRRQGPLGELAETAAIWHGLYRADAEAYIVRGGGGHLIAASAFCRVLRRR